jgi:hypothetical protein
MGCLLAAYPSVARADPITLTPYSSSTSTGSLSVDPGSFTTTGDALDLGTMTVGGGTNAFLQVDGLAARQDFTVDFKVIDPGASPWTSLTVEILNPLSMGFNQNDPQPQPSYVPAGYSTSNNDDGLSFAWNSDLDRAATFASGGQATVFTDEDTNAHDLLQFNGFSGGTTADVTFGLRDRIGDNNFLLRLSTNGTAAADSQTPEPASMLLLGTGLAALWRARRTRQAC